MSAQYTLIDFDICRANHGGDPESEAANSAIEPHKSSMRDDVIFAIFKLNGATCEECEDYLGRPHQTCSARISELRKDGVIVADGRRATRSGRMAKVYRLAGGKA